MTKQTLRIKFREMERNRPTDQVKAASRAIVSRLTNLEVFKRAKCVGAYLSLPSEVQTEEIIRACWEAGKQICVPYFIAEKRFYGMSRLDPDTPIKVKKWNLREPENPQPMDTTKLDLILVPALAFDTTGVRLGHGGGHYDRLLLNVTGYRLGLAFHEQVAESLPREPHDEPVQAILTEQKLIETDLPS